MKQGTVLQDLRYALDELHAAASNASLDHATQDMKDTPATLTNAFRFNDAVNYACDLLVEARQVVLLHPNAKDAEVLRKAERRLREIVLTFQLDFPDRRPTGDSRDRRTIH